MENTTKRYTTNTNKKIGLAKIKTTAGLKINYYVKRVRYFQLLCYISLILNISLITLVFILIRKWVLK